jgi:hypothetical protein
MVSKQMHPSLTSVVRGMYLDAWKKTDVRLCQVFLRVIFWGEVRRPRPSERKENVSKCLKVEGLNKQRRSHLRSAPRKPLLPQHAP